MTRRHIDASAAASMLVVCLGLANPLQAASILTEGFDSVGGLVGSGWVIANNSTPGGTSEWFQGSPGVFPSQAGDPNAYIAANFLNAGFGGDISNWLILPELALADGDELTFYTRSAGADFPDRLEVRYAAGSTTNVGGTPTSVGDFTTLLTTINPGLAPDGYPTSWTEFSVVMSGLVSPTGRLAFRYSVSDTSINAEYIGIDTISVESAAVVPEPATLPLIIGGLAALAWKRRARNRPR